LIFLGFIIIFLILNFTLFRCFAATNTPGGTSCRSFLVEVLSNNYDWPIYVIICLLILVCYVLSLFLSSLVKTKKESQ
jgi:hypothetical protein